MKTLFLKRLICLCIISALIVMTYNLLDAQTGPQVLDDPRYEIILKVNPDVFRLPEGIKTVELSEADTLSLKLQVISPEISEALKKHEVNKIRKAFPDFTQAERIKITRKGRLVTLRDKSNIHILRVKNIENVSTLIDTLKELPGVIYAESNYIEIKQANDTVMPDDDYFSYQWGLHNNDDTDIDAPEAWYITTGSNILVGVVDNGIRKTHEDFTGRVSGDTYNN